MNENAETTPAPEAVATAEDMPKIESPGALMGQEAIDAAYEAEQEKELQSILEQADQADAGADGDAGTPEDAPPPETAEPPAPATPEPPPPAAKAPETPATPTTPPDIDARLAQARLEGERTAAGRYGSERQRYEQRIAELEAKLAAGAGTPSAAAPAAPAATGEITEADCKAVLGDNWKEEWGEDGAKSEVRSRMQAGELAARRIVRQMLEEERQKAAQLARHEHVSRFEQELEAALPGAMALIDNRQTNGLDAYLDAPYEGTSLSRRDVVNAAIDQVEAGASGDAYRRALDTVTRTLKGYSDGRSGQPQPATPPARTVDPAQYVTTAARGTAGAGGARGGKQAGKTYKQADIDKYLDAAAKKGEAAYEAAQAWVVEQINAGRVVD